MSNLNQIHESDPLKEQELDNKAALYQLDIDLVRRVSASETTHVDALYLCGRLGLNANILRRD